jgi:acyl CoA:acetate/3-ketoacid CoA transferase
MHCKAIVTTNAISCAIWPVGCGSSWSSTSLRRYSVLSKIGLEGNKDPIAKSCFRKEEKKKDKKEKRKRKY